MTAVALLLLDINTLAPGKLDTWLQGLSGSDRARAGRIGSVRRRRQFIAGRYLLSGLIKERLGFDPVVVVAETGAPRIEGTDLCCSIAHSGDGVIVGFDEALPFGLDIEVLRQRDFDTLAAAYFHQREVSSLNDLPVEARCEEFYRLWTRKEALAKAHGQGITLGGLAEDVRGEHAGFLSLHTRRVGDFMVTTCCTDGRQPELLLAGPGVIFG